MFFTSSSCCKGSMSSQYDISFISFYWQYIVAGVVCYVSARIFYSILGNKFNEVYGNRREGAQITSYYPDEALEEEEFEEDMLSPLWSPNLKETPLVYEKFPEKEMIDRAAEFYRFMDMRRTVKHFSTEPVPIEIIRNIIRTAGTAPSGAHSEPWTYVVVSDKESKSQIREIIEKEEEINFIKQMGTEWTTDINLKKPNWIKEYLTDAPYLILVFKQVYTLTPDGSKRINYYNEMSANIAVGLLLTAIHYSGLVSLTSTPLNCGPALRTLLNRPDNEKLIILLPVGYPAENCMVPDLKRKPLAEILVEI